jgi:DNA-binding transcriptional regulator YbjK
MRLQPENRRAVIVSAAVSIAKTEGLHRVTHGSVAGRCKIQTSTKTVRHYFATQVELWQAVLIEVPELLGEGKELGL